MSLTISLKFTPAAPVVGKSFALLRVELTDSGNTVRRVDFSAAQIQAQATPNEDGSYNLPVTFATVGVGAYTVKAQAIDSSSGTGYGPIATANGAVSLADGVWIPAPVAFV
jgi:hypothetical protein